MTRTAVGELENIFRKIGFGLGGEMTNDEIRMAKEFSITKF
jgi:hypothetical protein